MKKLSVLIIALAVNLSFASAAELSVLLDEDSYTTVFAKGGDDELKSRIKELKERKRALRQESKILDQKLRIKKLEKQANGQEKKNKHKQVELDHQ
jgi:hypothetical protein